MFVDYTLQQQFNRMFQSAPTPVMFAPTPVQPASVNMCGSSVLLLYATPLPSSSLPQAPIRQLQFTTPQPQPISTLHGYPLDPGSDPKSESELKPSSERKPLYVVPDNIENAVSIYIYVVVRSIL